MKPRLASLFSIVLLCAVIGLGMTCSGGRGTYTTLASTEQAVVKSYDGYVDQVISGKSRTNELPIVAKSFDAFQASFRVAVDKASGDTNALITGDLSVAAAALLKAITTAESQPK